MTKLLTTVVAAVMVLGACGKDDDSGDKKAPPGKTADKGTATKAADKRVAETGNKLAPTGGAAKGGDFDVQGFCKAVFPQADVGKALGMEVEYKPERSRIPKALAKCAYYGTQKPIPKGAALLMVECRKYALNMAKHKKMLKGMGGPSYEDIDLGKGGAKAKIKAGDTTIVGFMHDKVPCWVQASTNFVKDDGIALTLAKMVHGKLSEDNRPK